MESSWRIFTGFSACLLGFSILEITFYFIYNRFFHPWKKIVLKEKREKKSKDVATDSIQLIKLSTLLPQEGF